MTWPEIVHWIDVAYAVSLAGYWIGQALGRLSVPDYSGPTHVPSSEECYDRPALRADYHRQMYQYWSGYAVQPNAGDRRMGPTADQTTLRFLSAPPRVVGKFIGRGLSNVVNRW